MRVTLKKNGNIEVKVGAFAPHTVGTWKVVSTWEHQGNQHNLFERKWWQATLKNGQKLYGENRQSLISVLHRTI